MSDSTAEAGVEEVVEETEEVTEETPAAESEAVEEDSDLETEDDEEQEEPEETLEFDFGGNKLSVPKNSVPEELAEKIDSFGKGLWSDYTKNKNELAESSKSLEARETAVQKLESLHGETLDTYSKGLAIKSELEQLSQYDMSSLWQSDPDQARRLSDTISQKQAEFNSIISKVSQNEQALSQAQQQEVARRSDEGKKLIEKRIPGFEAKVPEVIEYVSKNYGVPKTEADNWAINPSGAEMAYKAMLYDRMQAKAKAKPKPKAEAVNPVKPMKGKGGKQAKDPGKMSPDEYRKWFAEKNRRR